MRRREAERGAIRGHVLRAVACWLSGAELSFNFVQAGTTATMPAFNTMYTTFFDVDGDTINGGSVFELVSLLGATSRTIASTSTLEGGIFFPSEALFACKLKSASSNTHEPARIIHETSGGATAPMF